MSISKLRLLVPVALLGACVLAHAVPAVYTMTVDGVTATVNGVGTGAGTTTVIVINADTTTVTTVGAGHCVQGTSGTISNTGINGGAAQALSGNYFVCANNVGDNVGVYASAVIGNPVHGGNGGGGTGALTGAPAVDLISNLPVTSYIANSIHSHNAPLSLAGGGTYTSTVPEAFGNTTASTFGIAGVSAAAPVSVPTLSEWGLIILASIMGFLGVGAARRRTNKRGF